MRQTVRSCLAGLLAASAAAACGPSFTAVDAGKVGPGVDGPSAVCEGAEARCAGATFQRCVDGAWADGARCEGNEICRAELGCVQCEPSLLTCVGNEVHECTVDGQIGDTVQDCPAGECSHGRCADPCGDAEANRSYIGCEYWPVDLHNAIEIYPYDSFLGCAASAGSAQAELKVCAKPDCTPDVFGLESCTAGLCDYGDDCSAAGPEYQCLVQTVCMYDAQHSPFAVVVSNPDADNEAVVTLANAAGMQMTGTVAPNEVVALFPQQLGFPDQSIPAGGISPLAYRLTSNRPIVAYQFNPLDNVGVFSNDASLLLPAHAFDQEYYGITLPTLTRRPDKDDYNGYLTVVASALGTTTVSVTPTASVRAGVGMPAFAAGTTTTFSLTQWQTLTLEAVADGDLSGTHVSADDNPFGLFAGHVAAAPSESGQSCCADHLEDQMFPASTWGKVYAVARTLPRRTEGDRLRIMAQRPGTVVTINPPTGTCPTLDAGAFCEVGITGDVEISANEPIQIAHIMLAVGQSSDTENPPGDPSISFAVPTEQYRVEYALLVPMEYDTNFMALVAPADGTVALDDADVTGQLAAFGSGAYKAGRVTVTAGAHRLACPKGCGVEVGGYSGAVSYLFAGGLDLRQIVVD